MTQQTLLDSAAFADLVETMMRKKNVSHIEAILEICKERNLDVESIPELLTPKLRKRIADEATSVNMLKRRRQKVI